MPTPNWVDPADQRLSDALARGLLGPRAKAVEVAVEHLRWSLWCAESLVKLQELIALDAPSGDGGPTRLGYRSYPVEMGHLTWVAITAMGAVDRMAAALGALSFGVNQTGWVHDFRSLRRKSERIERQSVREWLDSAAEDDAFSLLDGVRDSLVHRTTLIRVTTSRSLSGRSGIADSGSFAFRVDEKRSVTAVQMLELSVPFVERLLLECLALVEAWEVAPEVGDS